MSFCDRKASESDWNRKVTLIGKVLALSHIFRTQNGLVYFIEVLSDKNLVHIVVNISSHQVWLKLIECGSTYEISDLCHNVLWKQTHCITVLVVTKNSEIKLRKVTHLDDVQSRSNYTGTNYGCFSSYKGIVTSVINDNLGIYEINEEVTLILSYLKGLLPEFSDDKEPSLKVGDHILVHSAHKLKGKEGNPTLVCCGRSFVRKESCSENSITIQSGFSENSILHCLHKYNLGIEFFYWLCALEEILIVCTPLEINHEAISKREHNGKRGALTQFIARLSDYKFVIGMKRSIAEEFLLKEHSCVVLKEFDQPFCPTLIKDISSLKEDDNEGNLWKHYVIKKNEHSWVIFGILKSSEEGYIKLETKGDSIIVIILETKHNISNKLNQFVAIINFDLVEETFSIFGLEKEVLTKKYIIVRSTNILNLVSLSQDYLISGSSYEIKVFSKSGLYFICNDRSSKNRTDAFFVCNTSISHINANATTVDSWQTLLCFKGDFVNLYPCISDKAGIKGKFKLKDLGSTTFKKKRSFAWLRNTHDFFGTTECADVPENFEIEKIETFSTSSIYSSVEAILEAKWDEDEVVSVEGWVTKRRLVSPLFDSENLKLSAALLNCQIGIPGSKILIFHLQDLNNSHANVCVYLHSSTIDKYVLQYPIGIIPGIKLRLTWVKKKISKQNNPYLLTTNFTTINIVSGVTSNVLPESISECSGKRKYISQISLIRQSSVVALLGTIAYIIVVNLRNICPVCESDFRNGRCDYVGCHATETGILTGSAKFVIDDGTGSAIVFTKDLEHIQILCNLNSKQWDIFVREIGKEPLSLSTKSTLKEPCDTNKLNAILNSSQVLRPMMMTCRTYTTNSVFSPTLFLLGMKPLNCNADWKNILE